MFILGISCFYHDSAAALIEDGKLIAAAQEERFTRIKHDYRFPEHSINFCLNQREIHAEDLDYVVFYEKPFLKFERILKSNIATYPKSWQAFREALLVWFNEKLWIKNIIKEKVGISQDKILFVEHHISHAASAYFCSPFSDAAILTVDGVGEWTTTALGRGVENNIYLFREIRFPHSLGLLYSAFTAFLGFKVNNGEYKVMGMAPYGKPKYVDKIYKLFHVYKDGSFWMNMDYFSYHYSPTRTFSRKFLDLFGEPRLPNSEFITLRTNPELRIMTYNMKQNQYYADIAASIQRVTEDTLIAMANYLHKETGAKNLCMAGGVALNSVANGRILRETGFEKLYIQPAAGDAGGALGAALYAYYALFGKPRQFVLEHAYWGKSYDEFEIKRYLDSFGICHEFIPDENQLIELLVNNLIRGKVIAWFQGRFEWGPRALGNRSILADPRDRKMKDIINQKVKFRESFRPFAPVVLAEHANEYFKFPGANSNLPARFMLLVYTVDSSKWDVVPAVTHEDGTARVQVLTQVENPRYYKLIRAFGDETGVPVLLNTSFNLRGEPIVNSPVDAIKTFHQSGIDILVLGRFLVRK